MIDNISNYIRETGVNARKASRVVAVASLEQKSRCLQSLGSSIDGARERIKEANAKDLDLAGKDSLDASLLDRLTMDDHTIDGMLAGLDQIDLLPDPVGEVTGLTFQRSGIQVGKMRVPLGVVAMIYESRPNVTIDAAALSIKSGNAVILRGGSEAFCSNTELATCVNEALLEADLPVDAVQLLKITDREAVGELLKLDKYIDVIVPRGGKGLIERVCNETNINVIKHLDGVCHVYVDDEVELKMALSVVFNSKVEKYGVCNAMETLLVHENIAASFLKKVSSDLSGAGVELRCCSMSQPICSNSVLADESDWSAEYLGPVLAIKIVASLEEAIEHINRYGSQHTDVICTSNYEKSRKFVRQIDSASVMVNSSSQFADGFEYGLGAEIGISTDKIHARGPVGLEGLTSQKYVVYGNGEIRNR